MKFYRFWARASQQVQTPDGRELTVETTRGSQESKNDALGKAREAVERLAGLWRRGDELKHYHYGENALREEILEELQDSEEQAQHVLTRNAYGACILNSAKVMFLDLDFPQESVRDGFRRWLTGLFGQKDPTPEQLLRSHVEKVVEEQGRLTVRLYRTKAGLRGIVLSRLYDPSSREAVQLLEAFGCDPLYIRLCQAQECFRARLTPKPWRLSHPRPDTRFPWRDEAEEKAQREWEVSYARASEGYAVCEYITTLGNSWTDREVQKVVELHDEWACQKGCPLA
jgi:hypothetical protein